jgi:hypothetical protein
MYVEFDLPTGAGGMAAQHINAILLRMFKEWAARYGYTYKTKTVKYTIRLMFEDPNAYTTFGLTWNPEYKEFQSWLMRYRFVEPMNPPKSID